MTATLAAGSRRWRPFGAANLPHPETASLERIPGKAGLPIVGVMPEALADPLGFARRMTAAHGPVYRFRAFGHWHVHAAGTEANERLLFDEAGAFSAAQGWAQLIEPLFPGALLILDGPEHRADRRLMGEAFRQPALDRYRAIFTRDIQAAVESWVGRRIDVYDEIRRLTFRIAASTFLDRPLDGEAELVIESLRRMIRSLLAMGASPLPSLARARGRAAKARLDAILARLVAEKRAAPGADFLSRMAALDDATGRPLPVSRICDSFSFLLSAAHDTLASSLTSLLYYLAVEPAWAERLRAELEPFADDPAAAATAALPLTDMFYKETLRLNGPAPVVWRRAMRDVTIAGHAIPAGTMTGANLMITHRLPELWPEPERFDPLRFSPDGEQARGRFAFAPFGGGVHKCLGLHFARQQARVFLASLLRRADPRPGQAAPVRWYHWPNCRPRGPFLLTVDRRCRER
ncbi:cytochrome P450 [Sphingosinicella terrae]|uniref:cytochrome P450 n=1 Tax=Sphingosinicella terrae TaxID=2172047 RepID=UPI0013B3FEC4|nr:cytochrome P450 [Sphingosinicella terrae]